MRQPGRESLSCPYSRNERILRQATPANALRLEDRNIIDRWRITFKTCNQHGVIGAASGCIEPVRLSPTFS
jgi:hypothetical protein